MVQALRKSRIRKGDTVVVISGRERGKSGKVLSVDLGAGKVVVEKLNIIKRHTKPNQKAKQGGHSGARGASPDLQCDVFLPGHAEADSDWDSRVGRRATSALQQEIQRDC